LGTVNKLRLEASNAVATCVDEAKLYIQNANVVGADETSFNLGNGYSLKHQNRSLIIGKSVDKLEYQDLKFSKDRGIL